MKHSEIEISFSVERYDEKMLKNGQNRYIEKKVHSFQTIKDIDLKF